MLSHRHPLSSTVTSHQHIKHTKCLCTSHQAKHTNTPTRHQHTLIDTSHLNTSTQQTHQPHCHPLWTNCHIMSPNITQCHPMSHPLSRIVIHCHRPVACHPTPPPPPLAPLPLGTSVTSVNLCHHYPVATVTTVTSVTIMNHYEPL